MRSQRIWLTGLIVLLGPWLTTARADEPADEITQVTARSSVTRPETTLRLDLDEVHPSWRERVQHVVARPQLHVLGPVETFNCNPLLYHWLVDHPEETAQVWRRLGAECAQIATRSDGRFSWKDANGSEVTWTTVVRNSERRVWFAEGSLKPGTLMPSFPLKAVLVLHIVEGKTGDRRTAVRHHAELVIQTDSRAAALASRLLGASAPRMAEQYLGQIEMFFAALAWYLDEYPDKSKDLLGHYRDVPH